MKRNSLFLLVRPVSCIFVAASALVGAKLSQGHWTFAVPVLHATIAITYLTGLALVWDSFWDIPRGGPIKGRYYFGAENKESIAVLIFGLVAVVSLSINGFSEVQR